MDITKTLAAKADRLVEGGNVTRVKGNAFIVLGDSGIFYSVWLATPVPSPDEPAIQGMCECPATTSVCSHMVAAAIYHLSNPEKQTAKEFRDPFEGLV